MIIVRCSKVPQRLSQKRKMADFRQKSHFAWRKSATKFLWVKTVNGKIVRHSLAWPNYPCKMIGGGDPFYLKFWIKLTALKRNRLRSLFARKNSDSAVTPSEKSSINTNRKSITRFPMSPRWTSYVVPKPPQRVDKNAVSKIWTKAANILKRY